MCIRGVDEVQEADERTKIRTESDPEQEVHPLVVADDQSSQRVRGLPGAAGPDGHLHAWQDPDAQDLLEDPLPASAEVLGQYKQQSETECLPEARRD